METERIETQQDPRVILGQSGSRCGSLMESEGRSPGEDAEDGSKKPPYVLSTIHLPEHLGLGPGGRPQGWGALLTAGGQPPFPVTLSKASPPRASARLWFRSDGITKGWQKGLSLG